MILRLRTILGSKLNSLLWQIALVDEMKELFHSHGILRSLKKVVHKPLQSLGIVDDKQNKVQAKHNEALRKFKTYSDHWEMGDEVQINWVISLVPLFEVFVLVIAVTLITTSYDPRPLACVIGPDDGLITYNNETQRVDLNFTDGLRVYQLVAVSVAIVMFILMAALFSILVLFYHRRVVRVIKAKSNQQNIQSDQANPQQQQQQNSHHSTVAFLRQSSSIQVQETDV